MIEITRDHEGRPVADVCIATGYDRAPEQLTADQCRFYAGWLTDAANKLDAEWAALDRMTNVAVYPRKPKHRPESRHYYTVLPYAQGVQFPFYRRERPLDTTYRMGMFSEAMNKYFVEAIKEQFNRNTYGMWSDE